MTAFGQRIAFLDSRNSKSNNEFHRFQMTLRAAVLSMLMVRV
jgi:hypothetical protein